MPGIDDGSKDMDMTERMLEAEAAMGVSHIFATPHFYAHRRSIDYFIERRERASAAVNELLERRPELPRITAGAEVFYFSGMGRAEQLRELCIEGTDILLLEMPFDQWHSDAAADVRDILTKQKLHVVLAHLDRYDRLQKDRRAWDEILSMPLTIQLNTESLINSSSLFRRSHAQRFCFDILRDYDNVIIGSDCHNMTDRKPDLAEARAVIENRFDPEALAKIDEYTRELLSL